MHTCKVNGMIDQKPSPNASAIDTGPAPMARHPTATTAIAITANTNASGYQRSDQSVIASAIRSRNPASEPEAASSARVVVVMLLPLACAALAWIFYDFVAGGLSL